MRVRFITGLDEAVRPLVDRLDASVRDDDLFATQFVVVPTAGVRAYLLGRLAHEFGVVANVEIGYLGLLNRFIDPARDNVDDVWSIERMTSVLLDVFHGMGSDARFSTYVESLIANQGGPLSAARYLADRFDRYSARRPHMIRSWDRGVPGLSPVATDVTDEGEILSPALDALHMPQFELWREVRSRVDASPWPVVVESLIERIERGEVPDGLPRRLTVVGLQSVSLMHLRLLQALGRVIDVDVSFVHPSPTLAAQWHTRLRDTVPTPGVLPLRSDPPEVDGSDPMVVSWLRGAWDLQCVLASQGVTVDLVDVDPGVSGVAGESLLRRLQSAVRTHGVHPVAYAESDHSLRVHRCHHVSRQVDVVKTAIARSFREIPDLRPHEVVILCADIDAAAPLLRAAFDQPIVVDGDRRIELPLVIADRSLRQVGEGTRLMSAVVAAVSGRASIDDVMSVATSPLVLGEIGADADDVGIWTAIIERSGVRWGFDVEHRVRQGLSPDVAPVGTWSTMIRSALLGAMVADATPAVELGGVVPLDHLEVSDLGSVSRLLTVLDHLADLELAIRDVATVERFASCTASTLVALAGPENPDLAEPLRIIDDIGRLVDSRSTVAFAEFARLVEARTGSSPGRQPLRTGAITATSMVPLRGVPYRVVCLVGFDDGVVGSGETAGDDLVDAQQFAGDPDVRVEARRAILDALTAAGERVIVTCNGRSVRNNTPIPLITPIAELVDMCARHGVGVVRRRDGLDHAAIEIVHPRHSVGLENFVSNELVPDEPWSIDVDALRTARRLGTRTTVGVAVDDVTREVDATAVSPDDLADLVADPLLVFVREGLGISTWSDDHSSPEPVLPLAVGKRESESEGDRLLEARLRDDSFDVRAWRDSIALRGVLPIGAYGEREVIALERVVDEVIAKATKKGVDLRRLTTREIEVETTAGRVFGAVTGDFDAPEPAIVYAGASTYFHDQGRWSRRLRLAMQLLTAVAAGLDVRRALAVQRHNESDKSDQAKTYEIVIVDSIDQSEARSRIEALVALYRRALVRPYPDFKGAGVRVAADRAEALKKFRSHVNSRKDLRTGAGVDYSASREALVMGLAPDFDTIYPVGGEVERFFADLSELVSVDWKNPRYLLS